MTVNIRSILTSGLVAGIIVSISAITMIPVVGNEMDIILANFGLLPLSNLAMVYFCSISFIFGIFLMFMYAVLKPQFASKTKTAITVSIIVWIMVYLIGNVSLAVYGFMSIKLVAIGSVWGLMELLLASIICSRLYKEDAKK
jgi:hypothetical protein